MIGSPHWPHPGPQDEHGGPGRRRRSELGWINSRSSSPTQRLGAAAACYVRDSWRKRATHLARQMFTPYGMSTAIGLATIDRSRMPLFLGAQGTPPADCTEEAAS